MTELLNTRIEIIFSKRVLSCVFGWFVVKNLCTGSCKFGDNIQVNYTSVEEPTQFRLDLPLCALQYQVTLVRPPKPHSSLIFLPEVSSRNHSV